MKNIRRGLGKGLGTGYKNLAPMDSHIHSLSAKGVKTISDYKITSRKPKGYGKTREGYKSDRTGKYYSWKELDAKGTVKDKNLDMTKKAYADCFLNDSNKAHKLRDLEWSGTPFMKAKDLKVHLNVVGEYNEFEPKNVYNIIKKFPELDFKLGREGSPVIYAQGSRKSLLNLKDFMKVYADEVDFLEMVVDKPYVAGNQHSKESTYVKSNKLRMWWD